MQFAELRGPQPRPAEARKYPLRSFAFPAGCGLRNHDVCAKKNSAERPDRTIRYPIPRERQNM